MRQNSLLRSWSFRLALGYASLFVASILIAFGVTYWHATQYSAQDETDEIGVELLAIQDEIKLAARLGFRPLSQIILSGAKTCEP